MELLTESEPAPITVASPNVVQRLEPAPAPAYEPPPFQVPEPTVVAAATPQEPIVLEPTILSLAHDILKKAIELNCSDVHLEPDASGLTLRYMLDGETLADVAFPGELTAMMIACYKHIAGMDPNISNRPQDKRISSPDFGSVDIRITTIPQDQGEMIAISIKRP